MDKINISLYENIWYERQDSFMILIKIYIEDMMWLTRDSIIEKRERIKKEMKEIVKKNKYNSKKCIEECIKTDQSGILKLIIEEEENKDEEEFRDNYVFDTEYTEELIDLCDKYQATYCYDYMYMKLDWDYYYENKNESENENENEMSENESESENENESETSENENESENEMSENENFDNNIDEKLIKIFKKVYNIDNNEKGFLERI